MAGLGPCGKKPGSNRCTSRRKRGKCPVKSVNDCMGFTMPDAKAGSGTGTKMHLPAMYMPPGNGAGQVNFPARL